MISTMKFLSSDEHQDTAILQTLCHSDLNAWCFFPLGEFTVSCCSDSFLRLWRLKDTPIFGRSAGNTSLGIAQLQQAMKTLNLSAEFLLEAVRGEQPTGLDEVILTGGDGLRMRVRIVAVLANDGLPLGRLIVFHPELPELLAGQMFLQVQESRSKLLQLSDREGQILNLLYEGWTNKAIALSTEISERTVEKHRARIMQKLAMGSTAELIRLVAVSRLFETPPLNGVAGHAKRFAGASPKDSI